MNTSLIILLICCMWHVSEAADVDAYCFQFTWPGPITSAQAEKINCSSKAFKGIPCIEPLIITLDAKPPNTTELWNRGDSKYYKKLHDGYTCIRYSYIFDNSILNISYYGGRLTDGQEPITSGCFYYKVDSKIIEVCACRSQPGGMPCNTTTIQTSSILLILFNIMIFLYLYNIKKKV